MIAETTAQAKSVIRTQAKLIAGECEKYELLSAIRRSPLNYSHVFVVMFSTECAMF